MHIKQINIQGFKSYKDQTFVDVPFNPHHNVIVGRNGSGKSNFFNAILFVLSEKYSKLRPEERQQLLHEGTGRGVMVAYVEIVFDNSDKRLPIDKDEVAFRRTIGLKKDEYRIDNKSVTQREVLNLLESAGFSSSNPYYVVEQGKVARLTTMKDAERLALLKEVAGTNVYDERRRESLKIMRTTNHKKKGIDDHIDFVEERIRELEIEVKKLKIFQKMDKKRKCLEYNLYNKERMEAREKLEELDERRSTFHDLNSLLSQQVISFQTKVKQLRKDYQSATLELNTKKKDERLLEDEKGNVTAIVTKLRLELDGMTNSVRTQQKAREKLQKEVKKLEGNIRKVQKQLADAEPMLEKSAEKENTFKKELATADVRNKALLVKQGGRKESFRSQVERDNWLKSQIRGEKESAKVSRDHIDEINNKIDDVKEKLKSNDKTIKTMEKHLKSKLIKKVKSLEKNVRDLREERSELTTLRKEKWVEQNALEKKVGTLDEQLNQKEKELESKFSRNVALGIQSVRTIIRERNIPGVYGTVIENFRTKEKFRKPVEGTAGNRLFNIIVEDDAVAAQMIEIMNEGDYPGRVTFIPLNKLEYLNPPRDIKDPSKSVSLLKVITYKEDYAKAFIYIFGKTYLCKSLEIATEFSKSYGVDTVTLGGDRVSRKGAMTGGFIDPTSSRLEIMDTIRNLKREKKEESDNFEKLKKLIETEIGAKITNVASQLNRNEPNLRNLKNQIIQQQSEIREIQTQKQVLEEQTKGYERQIEQLEVGLEEILGKENAYVNELKTPYEGSRLSRSEQNELDELPEKIEKLKKLFVKVQKSKAKHENQVSKLRAKLNTNLLLRKEEKQQQLDQMAQTNSTENMDEVEKRKQVEEREKELNSVDERGIELRRAIEELQDKVKESSEEIDKIIGEERKKKREMDKKGIVLEKLLNSKKIFERKENSAIAKIREIGSIPSEHTKYEEQGVRALVKHLTEVKAKLKEIGHVNKQAFDQHEQFTKQKEDFIEKKKELDEGSKAITNLIKTLDRKKNEAITRTFKQVSKYFKEVFETLVPGGQAQLIMNEVDEDEVDDEEEGEDNDEDMSDTEDLLNLEKEAQKIEKFTGVSIRVQFGRRVESQLMQQLSGGQKTLVALTLIFAIQKCDPAPFYLFDEIDSALDGAYRSSIAEMLQRQAHDEENPTQFITTTFKNELVDVADQWYKIKYSNKVSKIIPIRKDQAKSVLREQEGRKKVRQRKEEDEDDEDEDEEMEEKEDHMAMDLGEDTQIEDDDDDDDDDKMDVDDEVANVFDDDDDVIMEDKD